MAEADVEIEAEDADAAREAVMDKGLPWDEAMEADDGMSTTFEVLDPLLHGRE